MNRDELVQGEDYAYALGQGGTGKLVLTRHKFLRLSEDPLKAFTRPVGLDGAPLFYLQNEDDYDHDVFASRLVGPWGHPENPTHLRDGRYVRLVRQGRRLVEATA